MAYAGFLNVGSNGVDSSYQFCDVGKVVYHGMGGNVKPPSHRVNFAVFQKKLGYLSCHLMINFDSGLSENIPNLIQIKSIIVN